MLIKKGQKIEVKPLFGKYKVYQAARDFDTENPGERLPLFDFKELEEYWPKSDNCKIRLLEGKRLKNAKGGENGNKHQSV